MRPYSVWRETPGRLELIAHVHARGANTAIIRACHESRERGRPVYGWVRAYAENEGVRALAGG